ncbi:MAG TPA: helix-turn-helix transcriptional regulator [Candidatus Methylacidiphilales bacterium]
MPARLPAPALVKRVSRNLKRLRDETGLTQEELAERAGVSPRYIQFLEAGKQLPSLTVADALVSALGTTWDKLLSRS